VGASEIRLELLAGTHLTGVRELFDDPDVQRYTRLPSVPPPDFAASWIRRYEAGRRTGAREAFAIVGEGREFLGVALAGQIDRPARTAELGYMVSRAARGRGAASQALRLLTDWAFAQGLLRLELLISAENAGSKKVAARCGYVFEGLMRSKHLKEDRREDTEIWSRLPTDP
jgi:RimJ/RimL family protein N-acetyltransferase